MPKFPDTASTAHSLSARVFSNLAAKARTMTDRVYSLHVGDTWMEPFEGARAEAQRTENQAHLHTYSPVAGEPRLLAAIGEHLAQRCGETIDPACIQVTSGATSGLSVLCDSFLEPGDEVLLPSPFWPLIRGIIRKRGAKAVEVPIFAHLDRSPTEVAAMLEAAITPKTTAIYLNSPHNPTGRILSEAVVDEIEVLVRKYQLWVFCDEVYEEIYFGNTPPTPLWHRPGLRDHCIAIHSMSKAFGLAGARVGWAHGPAEAMRIVRGVQTFSTYCAAKPMQLGAAQALNHGRSWLEQARRSYEAAARATSSALGLPMPEGGTFVFFNVAHALHNNEDTLGLLDRILDTGVLLTPGIASGQDFETWVRLCFTCVPPAELDEALRRLVPLLAR